MTKRPDPVATEIIRNGLVAITEEMRCDDEAKLFTRVSWCY